jgi:drug/metabolite transporter (DMT)-like permease
MIWKGRGGFVALIVAAVVALAAGETLIAKGMKRVAEGGRWTEQVVAALRSPWIWAGGGMLLLHLILYMAALGKADLSLVLPLTAASYPLTTLLSRYYLGEHVGTTRWVGIVVVTVGVAVVGLGEAWSRR